MKQFTRREFVGATALGALSLAIPRLAMGQEVLKIGVVYPSPKTDIGWVHQHALAVEALKAEFGDRIQVSVVENVVIPQDAERVFREYASSGHKLIFATSFSHGQPLQRVARAFPDVAFEHCSGIVQQKNLSVFEARYHEGTFVAGAAAAMVSKSKKLGFVASFPVPDNLMAANGFLLGAQSIDPEITCTTIFLNSWFDPGQEKEAANSLISQGADVLCQMTDTVTTTQVAGERGIYGIGYASDMAPFGNGRQLTSYTLDWAHRYIEATRDVLNGTWESAIRWEGLSEGTIVMAPYNESALNAEQIAQLKQLEQDIASGKVTPFDGEVRDQQGKVRVAEGERLADDDIKRIDWFVQGMSGRLS